ncbi:MAG: FHA domain-containing protein [Thermoanaerobaculaceae bacterium]|nr:FHA domain-containing protein [Thermoanaerobaculaceae bacterium]
MMDSTSHPELDLGRFLASLASVTSPLPPAQAAPFAALLGELVAGSPSATTVWAALRAASDTAASGPAPDSSAAAASGWSAVLQPLPGLGSSLSVRRDADSTVLRFRLDASGTPRGAITIEGTDDVGVLEIEECPGGLQLRGFAGDRELSVALGEAPDGCWTSRPVLGRLGGEALPGPGGGPLAGLFTKRSDEPAGPAREPRTAAMPVPTEPNPPEPAPPPSASFILTYQSGPSPFDELSLAGRVVIGRETDCELRLDDPGVSRHHAAVEPTPAGARVTDLGSSNGTFVNGRRIDGPEDLAEGDEIAVGHTRLTLGRIQEARPAPASTGLAPSQVEPPAEPLAPAPPGPQAPPREPAEGPAARQCPGCGRPEPDPAGRFCRGCGQELPASAPAPAPPACVQCGSPLRAGERFCTRCGRKVV